MFLKEQQVLRDCKSHTLQRAGKKKKKNDMQLPQKVMGCLAPGLNVGRVVQHEGLVHESGAKCSAVI